MTPSCLIVALVSLAAGIVVGVIGSIYLVKHL